MKSLLVLLTALAVCGCVVGPDGQPADENLMYEFVCEEGDHITESWVGLSDVARVASSTIWRITSNTGDVTHYMQRPGERCTINIYEVETTTDISSTRA